MDAIKKLFSSRFSAHPEEDVSVICSSGVLEWPLGMGVFERQIAGLGHSHAVADRIEAGSNAEQVGLDAGDVIVSITTEIEPHRACNDGGPHECVPCGEATETPLTVDDCKMFLLRQRQRGQPVRITWLPTYFTCLPAVAMQKIRSIGSPPPVPVGTTPDQVNDPSLRRRPKGRMVSCDDVSVLLVDAQAAFTDGVPPSVRDPALQTLEKLFLACESYQLPLFATVQASKGAMLDSLTAKLPSTASVFTKQAYGAASETSVVAALQGTLRPRVAVAGAETDVRILQTVLGLIDLGYDVLLLEDCLVSAECSTAMARMYAAGAVPCTYKMLFYELQHSATPPPSPVKEAGSAH